MEYMRILKKVINCMQPDSVTIRPLTIHLASDHAGLDAKEMLEDHLVQSGHKVVDHGAQKLNNDDDYPDYIIPAAEAVVADKNSLGIIFGGSGQGEAIAANKVLGIRAIVFYGGPTEIITLSREHNDANVLSLGARFMSKDEVIVTVDLWLKTVFNNNERHQRRLNKINDYENSKTL